MDALHLKHLSRRLIQACGGLEKAAANCRLTHQRLQQCQSQNNLTDFLPIDVVTALEACAGEAIITGAAAQARPVKAPEGTPLEGAIVLTLTAAGVLSWLSEGGEVDSPNQRLELHGRLDQVEDCARALRMFGGDA